MRIAGKMLRTTKMDANPTGKTTKMDANPTGRMVEESTRLAHPQRSHGEPLIRRSAKPRRLLQVAEPVRQLRHRAE
jgi:hypothetical protein